MEEVVEQNMPMKRVHNRRLCLIKDGKQWDDHFQSVERNSQPRILYSAKLSLKNEGAIKTSLDIKTINQKPKSNCERVVVSRSAL